MKCPNCGSNKLRVIDTRQFDRTVRRVRFCPACMKGFETYEALDVQVEVKNHEPLSGYEPRGDRRF
jgi:transcriptional regulator NrdR family protein